MVQFSAGWLTPPERISVASPWCLCVAAAAAPLVHPGPRPAPACSRGPAALAAGPPVSRYLNLDIKTVYRRPTWISEHLPLDRRGRLGHNGRIPSRLASCISAPGPDRGPWRLEYHRLQE